MNTVEITVTRAGPEDYATLADLHGLCFDPPWDVKSMAGLFSTPGVLGLIAHLKCRAAGFALCRRASDKSELLALGVLPARRRAGIARVLLDAAIAALACERRCFQSARRSQAWANASVALPRLFGWDCR